MKGEIIIMFNVGDYIVYPMHGAGTVDAIEEKNILGEKQSYYIIKMPGEVKVMVPTSKAEEVGVRGIIDKNSAQRVFKILEEDETEMSQNWNKRYRDNKEKMKSGDEKARNILIERNLRLVAHVAKKYSSTNVDQDDLISIGTIRFN